MTPRGKQTVRDLRRSSRSTLLRHLYFHGPLSRQELGTATGLSAGSVSNVTGELLTDGLIEECGSVDSDGGRPRILLRVAPGQAHLVGVDIGETQVRVTLFDLALTELASADQPLLAAHDPERVVRMIAGGLDQVLATAGVPAESVLGIGIGVPGIVEQGTGPDAGAGTVVHGQTFGWDAVPFGRMLRAHTPLPLHVDNGAKTLGQAEMWFGAGRGSRHAVVALFGSGVGACVIADGTRFRGATSSAGEWGHTKVHVGGRPCRCGSRGCLEAYVGAEALVERWDGTVAGTSEKAGLAALLRAAEEGRPSAVALLDEAAELLGASIADLVNLFNPERIVIGGWAGLLLGPRLLPAIDEAATRYALSYPRSRTTITLSDLGPDAVTLGAATLPLTHFLDSGGEVPDHLAAAAV
ncbi:MULTISPECIES: ROK family transcriptional regulator [Kitasatospora]|uniref:Putative NagC family transcriptional regulator n=1 Tax=Kitasatospora setae (strain ATCC 33774 / DSM 43861 / JCM 3304 / KCC A-0304 / NBRC 14216 / KM-6054) TaxID=452652 RepID=E4MZV2_KITSK|nr:MULTISPECIES: ROK family transcriptional regulator [Kitasatospora]BAJ30036.1 putative NagC family transcriptional regulator [Kitasatospora setae KM-6054]